MRVEEGADPGEPAGASQEGIEVRHRRADPHPRLLAAVVEAADVDPQVAAAATRARDQDALLDRPGDPSEAGPDVVDRRAEAQQHEPAPAQHDESARRAVADLEEAERDPLEVSPVRPSQALERLRPPQLLQALRR